VRHFLLSDELQFVVATPGRSQNDRQTKMYRTSSFRGVLGIDDVVVASAATSARRPTACSRIRAGSACLLTVSRARERMGYLFQITS
jgi:hypothetical protein